jgi:hypothetical protein
MPKNSSKSKKDWVSGEDLVRPSVPKRAWAILAAAVVLGIAAFFFWKPKALVVENIVPSGAIAFVRVDHVQEHLAELRASHFWQSFSKVDVPKLLQHSELDPKTIDVYNAWRSQMVGTIDHPLFKQFLGREVAVAFYPIANTADPRDWKTYVSGALMITRIDAKAQVTESLASLWSQGSKEWMTQQTRYKNNTITAVHFKNPGLTVYYTRLHDLLVFSLNENLVASAIDTTKHKNLSLNLDGDFSAVAKDFYRWPDSVFYVQVPKVVDFLAKRLEKLVDLKDTQGEDPDGDEDAADDSGLSVEDIQDALDRLEGVKIFGTSLAAGRPLKSKVEIILDPQTKPETAGCVPTENFTINFVPKEAIIYQWADCFDFAAYYRGFQAEEDNPEDQSGAQDVPTEPQTAVAPFAELEKTWGFSIEKDLLPILGHELGWFVEGVDVKGLFPVPKLVLFVKTNDEKKAGSILKQIVTTPVTLVQQEDYNGFKIHFVSIPLFVAFKPSYTFINGYVLISTSDDLLKASIDSLKDETKSLRDQPGYKDLSDKTPKLGNGLLYVSVGDAARQSRSLVDWTSKWFLLKIKQADSDEDASRQKVQALKTKIADKGRELKQAQDKLIALKQEEKTLQAAFDANSVAAGSKDTLAQPGAVVPEGQKAGPSLEDLKFKRSQVAGIELEIDGINREIDDLESQGPDLEDDIDDSEQQKKDAQNFRYYVEEVAVPLLEGLESLSGYLAHTTLKDNAIESEMFLKTE